MTDLEKEIQEIKAAKPVDTEVSHEPAVIPENTDHIPADDTVSLYFRQMASEPLLTAEQEVMLAKRIEKETQSSEEMSQNRKNLSEERRSELQALVKDAQAA